MLTFPIFLIATLFLTFIFAWKTKIHWSYKAGVAALYFVLTIVFWNSATSYLGYPADGFQLDDKVITVYSILIKEPTRSNEGGFYITATDRVKKYDSFVMRLFGAKLHPYNPKLFVLPYDKDQHQAMQKMQDRTNSGKSPMTGKFHFKKDGKSGEGKGLKGKGGDKGKSKEGGQSPGGADYHFHELPPNKLLPKGDPPTDNPLDDFDLGRTFQT